MLKEFRDFIAKGNVMDMAVGIIIGAAFTAIVNSVVADLINPMMKLTLHEQADEARAEQRERDDARNDPNASKWRYQPPQRKEKEQA